MRFVAIVGLLVALTLSSGCQARDAQSAPNRLSVTWDSASKRCEVRIGERRVTDLSQDELQAHRASLQRPVQANDIKNVPDKCRRGAIYTTELNGKLKIGFIAKSGPETSQ
jgi:hypothetical protein